jgi:acyl-coenzyme A thioesterase PaaI-like protein
MELKYIKPVSTKVPLSVTGSIISSSSKGKLIMVRGELRDENNNLLAKSRGEFVEIDREDISPDLEGSKKEIFSLIDQLPPL